MGLTAERTILLASLGRATNAGLFEAARFVDGRIPAVELRLDALEETPDLQALREAFRGRTLLATLRSRSEGGRFEGTDGEAARLLGAALDAGFDLADVEFARAGARLLGLPGERVVVSAHDVAAVPDDLEERAARMEATGARYVKVVATARGLDDTLRLLRLQESGERGRCAVFGMGEAGLVTRVLSPYLGAGLSFGAALPGEATAPGQLLAADLLDVYAVGRSRRVDSLFALLGSRVSHSFSPAIHNAAFEALGLAALYVPIALGSLGGELGRLRQALEDFNLPLRGASVTIPFKEEASALAEGTAGSVVNTLLFGADGIPSGTNTDRVALLGAIPAAPESGAALVLGAGGMARAAVEALRDRGWAVDVTARTPGRAAALAAAFGARVVANPAASGLPYGVVVNATPLGLDAADPLPCDAELLSPGVLALDAPYRPGGTAFSLEARSRGARFVDGFTLLLSQAAGQSALFTGRPADAATLAARLPARIRSLFEVKP
ncbi:MAG TPA: type I 3-dehydroquinate dehydratase [Thermoanaerobaculia bacterium]|nr:type I 3-dehydroquinate dehydratase [Thermoanaerobaculia bacterium]